MKKKICQYGAIALFMVILILPAALGIFTKLTGKRIDEELKGYYTVYKRPDFSLSSFMKSEFQTDFSNWFNSKFEPRGFYIKNYNTICFNLFKDSIDIIGKDNYIYEYDYVSSELCIDDYNNYALDATKEKMDNYIFKLEAINEKLLEKDKHLFFYVSASKADEYRDYLPLSATALEPEGCVRGVDYLRDKLSQTDIEYLFATDMTDNLPCESFYATGIHWSRPFEQKVNLAVIEKVEELTGKNYRKWELGELKTSPNPYFRDTDVYDMLNLRNDSFTETFYQYDTANIVPDDYDTMNLLIQGGSFAIGLRKDIWDHYPDENLKYINYCEYFMDNTQVAQVLNNDWNNVDLKALVDESDCVVIEMNEGVIYHLSDGFVDRLYEILCEEEDN